MTEARQDVGAKRKEDDPSPPPSGKPEKKKTREKKPAEVVDEPSSQIDEIKHAVASAVKLSIDLPMSGAGLARILTDGAMSCVTTNELVRKAVVGEHVKYLAEIEESEVRRTLEARGLLQKWSGVSK